MPADLPRGAATPLAFRSPETKKKKHLERLFHEEIINRALDATLFDFELLSFKMRFDSAHRHRSW